MRILFSLILVSVLSTNVFAADSYLAFSGHPNAVVAGPLALVTSGTWTAEASDDRGDGKVTRVQITRVAEDGESVSFVFEDNRPNSGLRIAGFTNASMVDRDEGNVFLIQRNHETLAPCPSGELAGFTVIDARFDLTGTEPQVLCFVARFEFKCGRLASPVKGIVAFDASDVPEVTAFDYSRERGVLSVYGPHMSEIDSVGLNGISYQASTDDDGVLVARGVELGPGQYAIVLHSNSRGARSPKVVLTVEDPANPPFRKTILRMESEPGNDIGQGRSYKLSKGTWVVRTEDASATGGLDTIALEHVPRSGAGSWSVEYSTALSSTPIRVGGPDDFVFGNPSMPSHDSLVLSGESRTCERQLSTVTITDFELDETSAIPRLVRFGMTFEQRCNLTSPVLRGTLRFVAVPGPNIVAVRYAPETRTLRIEGTELSAATLHLDGNAVEPSKVGRKSIELRDVALAPGLHVVFVAAGPLDEAESTRPFVFRVPAT